MPTLTPETFAALFTREGLRPFQPRPGTEGLTPLLEVLTPDAALVFVLALDGFNDSDTRQGYLTTLGARCAAEHEVLAVRFGSEAWTRAFTAEEVAARGGRLVETYADKEEVIVVMGQMADGPGYMAQARLHRRRNGTVAHLDAWTVATGPQHRAHLLECFWRGYHKAKEEV